MAVVVTMMMTIITTTTSRIDPTGRIAPLGQIDQALNLLLDRGEARADQLEAWVVPPECREAVVAVVVAVVVVAVAVVARIGLVNKRGRIHFSGVFFIACLVLPLKYW
jgi:hypothetical protein